MTLQEKLQSLLDRVRQNERTFDVYKEQFLRTLLGHEGIQVNAEVLDFLLQDYEKAPTFKREVWLLNAVRTLLPDQDPSCAPQAARVLVYGWLSQAMNNGSWGQLILREYTMLTPEVAREVRTCLPWILQDRPQYQVAFWNTIQQQMNSIEIRKDQLEQVQGPERVNLLHSFFEDFCHRMGHHTHIHATTFHLYTSQPAEVRQGLISMLLQNIERTSNGSLQFNLLVHLIEAERPLNQDLQTRWLDFLGQLYVWPGLRPPLMKLLPDFDLLFQQKALPAQTRAMLRRTFAGDAPAPVLPFEWLSRFSFNVGEHWADHLQNHLETLPAEAQQGWQKLFEHCISAAAKPSAKWLREASIHLHILPEGAHQVLLQALTKVPEGRSLVLQPNHWTRLAPEDLMDPYNASILKGLLWLAPLLQDSRVPALLAKLTEHHLQKMPGVGPRNPKLAHAAIHALGELESEAALAQLARLKTRVKHRPALKEIEKALAAKARKLGVSPEDLEELGLPTYGLDGQGQLTLQLEDFTVRVQVRGREVDIGFVHAAGKTMKSPPARLKQTHGEALRELKTLSKDIPLMLTTVANRLDGLYLQQKSWPLAVWQQRYLQHPLMGLVARRLIWRFQHQDTCQHLMWDKTGFVDAQGQPQTLPEEATVSLWHPLDASTAEVLQWRDWLLQQGITQPFKQAFREVYLLTPAEEQTRVYSNRFAAHILRQHAFNALCVGRGWDNQLRMMVDDSYRPPRKQLLPWNLRAEFWVEGAIAQQRPETTDSGTYLYLYTDQVRFYALGASDNWAHAGGGGYSHEHWMQTVPAEPIPLQDIPPLVFSEVMRDVDLFVGVCSVGNDPDWTDGGAEGRHRDYWQSYSFGELNETAQTRKDLLTRLIPRLKIRERASIEGRFLRVQGQKRTYKIHLGSGNILMEPHDQYLCIVAATARNPVALPFEDDRTLSIILSKAFLLAEDHKITDPTILRQIGS